MLKFSKANNKIKSLKNIAELQPFLADGRKVYSLDLLSGWSCPGARDCQSRVCVNNGKCFVQDGPHTKFRCFSASQEATFPNVYKSRKHNYDMLKTCKSVKQFYNLISKSLPKNLGILRYHVAGDFYCLSYLKAAIKVAAEHPDKLFYAYTKSLFLLDKIDMLMPSHGLVRQNFILTTSHGGKYDNLIPKVGLRTAKVIFNESEANGLPIDHDDSHAATTGNNFALLLHGIQPKGSLASKALRKLRGHGSYGKVK